MKPAKSVRADVSTHASNYFYNPPSPAHTSETYQYKNVNIHHRHKMCWWLRFYRCCVTGQPHIVPSSNRLAFGQTLEFSYGSTGQERVLWCVILYNYTWMGRNVLVSRDGRVLPLVFLYFLWIQTPLSHTGF